ncbi:endolytic transglycosylase MltG [uncultured Ilumatobacter sp.]|uniref:endolytic transglycosylase MltG n=1 Tax=uncultured Ilumatobacter sp. TaxID=879968 RepID=UPI00374E216B
MTQLDPLLPEAHVNVDDRPAMDWPADPWDPTEQTGSVERLRRQTRPIKWFVYTSMVLVTAVVLIAGAVGWWYLGKINPQGDPSALQSFTVPEAADFDDVTELLFEEGYISDVGVWKRYVGEEQVDIVNGFYQLRLNDHMGNVLARLRIPPAQTSTSVTFPEGFTIERMARRVDAVIERMDEAEFIASAENPSVFARWLPPGTDTLEGLLFPDTYSVSNADTEPQLLDRMIALMERVGEQEDLEAKARQLGYTPYEVLIVASLIEREAAVAVDRAKISRVILNRTFVGMNLEIDASVYYGRNRSGIDPDLPFSALRQIDTPWNTYLRNGLPATPIANPGRASIRAALNPAPNPAPGDPICVDLPNPSECFYFFYVLANEDGGHAFAATFEQHEANIREFAGIEFGGG